MKRIGILLIFFSSCILVSTGCSNSTDIANKPIEHITNVPEDNLDGNEEEQKDNNVIPTEESS